MRGFLKKEFLQIFRDYRSLMILFGMPIVQVMLFGYAITMEIKDVPIAVLDHSRDEYSTQLVNKITSSGYFQLQRNLFSEQDIEEAFRSGKIKEVIILESNFTQKFQRDGKVAIQILTDASDPNTASIITSYTQALVNNFQLEKLKNSGAQTIIQPETRFEYNSELRSVFMFVALSPFC